MHECEPGMAMCERPQFCQAYLCLNVWHVMNVGIALCERHTTPSGITLSERVACHEYEADIPLCERITTISGITLSGRVACHEYERLTTL